MEDPLVGWAASRAGCSPAQVVLRWAWQAGLCTLFRTSRPARVREALQGLGSLPALPEDVSALLSALEWLTHSSALRPLPSSPDSLHLTRSVREGAAGKNGGPLATTLEEELPEAELEVAAARLERLLAAGNFPRLLAALAAMLEPGGELEQSQVALAALRRIVRDNLTVAEQRGHSVKAQVLGQVMQRLCPVSLARNVRF